jgi:hypothetical protein
VKELASDRSHIGREARSEWLADAAKSPQPTGVILRGRVRFTVAVILVALIVGGATACASRQRNVSEHAATRPAAHVSAPLRLRRIEGPPDAHDLDLSDLVPGEGRIDHVWYVPAGSTKPEVVVGWHHQRGRRIAGFNTTRYVLTLWSPVRIRLGFARWTPRALIPASPFPFSGRSVRLSDVTGDGHDDLLVTIVCADCNHGAAVVSVFANIGTTGRRIYGRGSFDWGKGASHATLYGRTISETWWGAQRGLLWFDEPRGGISVCCPAYRLQTFLRWTGDHRWTTAVRRHVLPEKDLRIRQPFP